MKASRLRLLMNIWPPYLAAGIRVRELSDDYRRARVDLRRGWLNRNYVGVHFGGSLFAMTDPFYMLMYMKNLGSDYVVWDRAGRIEFLKPGRETVSAKFQLSDRDLERARIETRDGRPWLVDHDVEIRGRSGLLVARVERTVYVRRKG
ncbi:MAG: DUF4442 domain-containing protein [Wenzhouxiangella sp.]|nr:DUF4442 domain-containing protein [Wenzhouxiangella sp.]TVR97267.1 MAG: DUF4442 domain-containing protein [Wenzhouxiangellaceae bacterium]